MEQEEKKYSILDELAKCSGYDMALMTTFNFEIGFFERAVLNRLFAKDVKTVSLYVDSSEFTNTLNEFDILNDGTHIGMKYMVSPVNIKGSFHPKIILLLGEKKARLFVGSANIKTSGYATNNEVFNFIDYDAGRPENLDVIVAAIDFFEQVSDISYKLDNNVLKVAKEYIYYHKAEKNGERFFLHNLKNTILEQLAGVIPNDIESIWIAVPYYDKELLALQQIKKIYPDASISLYVQNRSSTFPIEYNEKNHIVENIIAFGRFYDNKTATSSNFYHGKVFLFKNKDHAFILYGSANCTLSALSQTYVNGGNVECDLLETGGVADFDYFFENMELKTDEELTSQELVYEPQTSLNFSYKYGEVKEGVELHIGFSQKVDDLLVKVGDQKLDYKYSDREIIVYIGEESRNQLTDIFEISLIFGEQTEILRCWTYNPVVLANNREVQNRQDLLNDFEINSTGNKYIEERIKFLMAEATCFNDWQEYKKNLKYMNQIKMEQETEGEGTEDFIVDYQIPDEYRYAYRQYSVTSKIRNTFVRRFLDTSFICDTGNVKDSVNNNNTKTDNEQAVVKSRKATSEEKRFERFIKGKVRGMTNDIYVNVVELEHYIGLVEVVLEIFDRYCKEENVEDIFIPEYVLKTKSCFMRKIIGKPLENIQNKNEIRDAIIRRSFQTIFETYNYYCNLPEADDRGSFKSLNKTLLSTLEKEYSLRQSYKPYVEQIMSDKSLELSIGVEAACNYIEQIYGYKTYEMLCNTIDEVYSGAEISLKGTSIKIIVKTDRISNYAKPDSNLLREISNYSRNVSKVSMVYIEIVNTAPNITNKNTITKIVHSINMDYSQWRRSEIRFGGERVESKPQYLYF